MATAISAPFEPTSNVQDKTFNPYFAQGDQMLKSVRSLQSDSVSADADATSERIVNSINSMTRQVRNRTTRAPAQIPAAEFSRVSVAKEAEEKQEQDGEDKKEEEEEEEQQQEAPKQVSLASCAADATTAVKQACDDTVHYVENNCSTVLWVTAGIVLFLVIVGMCASSYKRHQMHVMEIGGGGEELSIISGGGSAPSMSSDFSSLSFLSTE